MKFIHALTRSRQTLILTIGIVCLIATNLPLFRSDFFRPHDFTHAARIAQMQNSLRSGEFPVRWSEHFGFGYGMPLFNFYAPLPYYLAQFPYALTQDAILSIKFLYLLNGVLAFAGMYFLATRLWQEAAPGSGVLSAVFFSLSTYRALDLFVRGAIGEVFAMVLIPWALFGLLEIATRPRRGMVIATLALAAILLSHNLIGMLSLPLFLFFGWMRVRSKSRLLLCLVFALGLSAFYTLPAFFEKEYTRVEQTITGGYFDYQNHFVALRQFIFGTWGYGGSVPGLEDGMSFALGYVPILLALFGSAAYALRYRQKSIPTLGIVGVPFLVSLFFASNRSAWVWEQLSLLKFLQFPWRFLTFSHVFLALLVGASAYWWRRVPVQRIAISLCVLGLALTQLRYFQPEQYLTDIAQYYSTDPGVIARDMSRTLNDYLPPAIVGDHYPSVAMTRARLRDGNGRVETVRLRSHRMEFRSECSGSCQIEILLFRFPGWTAYLDGDRVEWIGGNDEPTYRLIAPDGEHRITVKLHDTPVRRAGNLFSLAALGFGVMLLIIYDKRTINR